MKVVIPDLVSNSYFPAIAAVELGFFKEEGLDAELELIYPVDNCYRALRDGKADFVGGSSHSAPSAFPAAISFGRTSTSPSGAAAATGCARPISPPRR